MDLFPIRLKELREEAGYTSQQAFANAFGVAQSTVGGWESGSRTPSQKVTMQLAKFFNVTSDYLCGNVNEPFFYLDNARILREINELPDDAQSINTMSAKECDHIKKYRTLDPYGQEAVDGVLDTEYRRCLDDAKSEAATLDEQPTPPPVEVAGPAVEPDYRQMPFAAHGPVPEAYTEEEGAAVENFLGEVARRKHAKKND